MKTNKNIDRLFQEKLKDFEVSPPDSVWENIDRNLKTNKPKLLFPLWLRIGSAAAILMLITIRGINYFSSVPSDINNDNIIVTDSDSKNTPKINKEILKKSILNSSEENESIIAETNENDSKTILSDKKQVKNKELFNSNNEQNTIVVIQPKKIKNDLNILNAESGNDNNYFKQNVSLNKDHLNKTLKSTNNTIVIVKGNNSFEKGINLNKNRRFENKNVSSTTSQANRIAQNNTKETGVNHLTNKSDDVKDNFEKVSDKVENIVAQTENKEGKSFEEVLTEDLEKETEENAKKWSVASVFAPIFYNSFNAKGSPLDLQFENSPKQGSKTISYGVKIGYKINKKLSLQSGVTLVNVGYKIGDVFINTSQQGLQRLTNVNYSSAANILNVNAENFLNNVQLETSSSAPIKGVLNQEFGYIEVPLELKYKLNNSQKLGINLVGGFSVLFLNKNEVFVETAKFSSNLGEANNLNNVNFSGNLGIDIDYKINKNIYFNVAPMLKIHTSTFSKNADNFKPYILGVYTGLNYKF